MGEFNVTGQVPVLGNESAKKAKASGAATEAGYLGGTTWLKTNIDAARDFYKGINKPGYQAITFADALEGLSIPDGEFDFFDKTFNLNEKDVKDLLVRFSFDASQSSTLNSAVIDGLPYSCCATPLPLPIDVAAYGASNGAYTNTGFGGSQLSNRNGAGFSGNGATFIVSGDYTECGPYGSIEPSRLFTKGWGTNPPPTDAMPKGSEYIYRLGGATDNYANVGWWQYKDSTDANPGFRYMVGLYNGTCGLSTNLNQDYVIKSMSINTTNAGQCQLVLHFRKTEPTSGVNMDLSEVVINTLKINI